MALIYGFIGCGRMGRPMAQRLLNAGKKVIVCDADAKAVGALVDAGAQAAATPADLARSTQTVDEAEALGVPMVVGAAVRQMLAITNCSYGPDSDFTSVCRVVESWARAEVRARRS